MHTDSDIEATMTCPVAVGQIIDMRRQDGLREIVTSVKNNDGEINVVTEVLHGEAGYYRVKDGELRSALDNLHGWARYAMLYVRQLT